MNLSLGLRFIAAPAKSGSLTLRTVIVALVVAVLPGCAITIQKPSNNDKVVLPAPVSVVISGNADYTGLQVAMDGNDVTAQVSRTGPRSHRADLAMQGGPHVVTASAEVDCWYCSGRKTHSTDSSSFIVTSAEAACQRIPGTPVITLDSKIVEIGQRPGRQLIAYALRSGDGVLIVVDDAPELRPTLMRVEIDIDPYNGVTWNKAVQAWPLCHSGSLFAAVEASMLGGFNEGTACLPLSAAHDYRSGCTRTQTMLLSQESARELWFRKPGFFGFWRDVEAIDESIWKAFGGRSVRLIWRFD